jgi:hypothetical protein
MGIRNERVFANPQEQAGNKGMLPASSGTIGSCADSASEPQSALGADLQKAFDLFL